MPPKTAPIDGGPPTTEPLVELKGRVERITFSNPDNGFSVVRLREENGAATPRGAHTRDGLLTVVGAMPGVEIAQEVRVGGQWTRDAKFGLQLRIEWFKPSLPSTTRGMEVYLASGAVPGVGPVTARRIVQLFGERTFDVLDREPHRLSEIPKLGRKKCAQIVEAWRAARGDRELVTFLGEYNISPAVAARLRKVYGENALAVVRANPYRLARDVRGIAFQRADEIARKMGLAADSNERIDAALAHALERESHHGHTCLPRVALEETTAELVGVGGARIVERLERALETETLARETIRGHEAIFLPPLHEAERRAAALLERLIATPKRCPQLDSVAALADFEQRTQFRMAPAQREAVLTLARQGMLILTGGPGTGKTTTVRAAIELFKTVGLRVKLAAPTGRAARHLAETSKCPAETLHRLLGYRAALGRFTRCARTPVEADLVIVDEVSMLDAMLASHLLDALAPPTCLLLVGDEDQLPSVGPGQVLGDLIASERMPVVRLTEIFRQAGASQIVVNAHRVNQGRMPILKPPPGVEQPDFFFVERDEPGDVAETIRTLIAERIPNKFGLDPMRDVQILTPMRRGELGVTALNDLMKAELNPGVGEAQMQLWSGDGGEARRSIVLSVGDRLMQTVNNYDKIVFNGDIGHVVHINTKTEELVVRFDERDVGYLRDELDQLTLAYAVTIHKSQGSEYPAVVMPIHTQHWIMLQRNLIYTAITRARRLVCMVGTRRALGRAVTNAERAHRYTALRHFLERGGEHV